MKQELEFIYIQAVELDSDLNVVLVLNNGQKTKRVYARGRLRERLKNNFGDDYNRWVGQVMLNLNRTFNFGGTPVKATDPYPARSHVFFQHPRTAQVICWNCWAWATDIIRDYDVKIIHRLAAPVVCVRCGRMLGGKEDNDE